jgi:hypothetical protein
MGDQVDVARPLRLTRGVGLIVDSNEETMSHQLRLVLCIAMVVAFVLYFGSLSVARPSEGDLPEWNGSHWKEWNDVRKAFYVFGFRDGVSIAVGATLGELGIKWDSDEAPRLTRALLVRATGKQIMAGIDHVYADFRNEGLPLRGVVQYVLASIGGFADESELQKMRERSSRYP